MRSIGRFASMLLVLTIPALLPVAAQQARVQMVDGERPAVLERVDSLDRLSAIAISGDGVRAALARSSADKPGASVIELVSAEAESTNVVPVPGVVRALLFDRDGSRVFGLLHKPAKKREGDTHLIQVEWEPARFKRVMRLPPSARGLDHWPARDSLLVASRNELRTVSLPDFRSGRLFRVTGSNLAVAALAGGSLVLVGQQDGLTLVDLDDPPGEETMPVRDRVDAPGPVVSLAAASDGSHALARLAGGPLYTVSLVPLRIVERGTAGAVAALRKSDAPPAIRLPPAAPAERPPMPPPPPPTKMPTANTATEAPVRPPTPPPTKMPTANTATEAPVRPPTPPPGSSPRSAARLHGRLAGPAAGRVHEVVLLGPNNILREAARVRPAPDGTWELDGLAPGRYRVQVDGGGDRVLISDPPFLLIDVVADQPQSAPELQILRAL